jgi:hypothetical protein
MTHDELVERVARSIFATEGKCYDDGDRMFEPIPWEELDDDDYQCIRGGYRDKAIAAISTIAEALKEPTSAMIRDGVSHRLSTKIGGDNRWPEDTAALYRAMLEASPLYGEKK